ncbi:lipid A phosphoethanolamine transferase [Parabacteroides provencensis]|uniref:lipid A phosphoethanolamine transferase n=1 Tax=Parabacteroides provencensis TaxID=1944636 RepID=UPI000C15F2A5|nr:lipid A phosphoethanolamine transferase [Parabacteroides provencensis]
MKHFKNIYHAVFDQQVLFFFFLFVLIVPNIFFLFTEKMSFLANLCNILVPLSFYWFLMSLSAKPGKVLWILFPFIFFGAFQLVLLYLFGESIIAVDMFLNLATTNSSEAMELLDNLTPAIIGVCFLYLPALALGIASIYRKEKLTDNFLRKEKTVSSIILSIGVLFTLFTYQVEPGYKIQTDMFPLNVCYNVGLAIQRQHKLELYKTTSSGFTFQAKPSHAQEEKEIYVLVIGETSRALNWGLYGYERNTTPQLARINGLTIFKDALTQSNTTHKSVPILLSAVSADNYDCIYKQKGIITAFKEAGFHTAFFSNQRPNHSFIDFFGEEADIYDFIKEDSLDSKFNPSDDVLLDMVEKEIRKNYNKQFIVLHTYGSHFNYQERYPATKAAFLPDQVEGAEVKYRTNLINAYDNTICYTDDFLSRLITILDNTQDSAAMLYTSDHGEDIFDDNRNLFLHASPVPSYYQLHVPYLIWMSQPYLENHISLYNTAKENSSKAISSNSVFHTMLDIGGIDTPYKNDSLSVVSKDFKEQKRLYLNDHNLPILLKDIKLKETDFNMFRKMGIKY